MTDNKKDMRDTYTIYDDQTIGKVQIADEVVAIIAGLAATEAEGVASMAGNITNELVGKLGMKNLSKGVKVDVLENVVCVNLNLNLEYGYSIPETCKKVQEKVKTAIENMTGLEVSDVNISIAGVALEEEKYNRTQDGRKGGLDEGSLFYYWRIRGENHGKKRIKRKHFSAAVYDRI